MLICSRSSITTDVFSDNNRYFAREEQLVSVDDFFAREIQIVQIDNNEFKTLVTRKSFDTAYLAHMEDIRDRYANSFVASWMGLSLI